MEMFSYSQEEASRQQKTRIRLMVIPYSFAVVLMLVGVFFTIPDIRLEEYVPTALIVLAIAGAVGFVKIRSAGKSASSIQFVIHADAIEKTQFGSDSVKISRSQIRQVNLYPGSGIRVDSKIPGDQIFIPKEIENFARIESILSEWHPPTEGPRGLSPWLFVMLGYMALSAILLFIPGTQKIGVVLWGFGMVGTAIVQIVLGIHRFLVKRRLDGE